MESRPLRTTVIGSYPFPGWLEFASGRLDQFGSADREEMVDDAVTVALQDQLAAGVDVVTDGEQTRLDFNLSFYGFLRGIELESDSPRLHGPPAHDQRGKHAITGELVAPDGLGAVEDFERFKRLASRALDQRSNSPVLKASVPGPFTLSGRLLPNSQYADRYAITEALLPIVRQEPARFVDIFNRTVEPIVGKCRLSTHLCFGNFKGHAVGYRRYAPMFPAFLDLKADEIHVEMASREYSELEIITEIAKRADVAVGIVDVKSYFIEPPEFIAERVRECLQHAPADRLSFAPDCGLSQTARWAARKKLANMVAGVDLVRENL